MKKAIIAALLCAFTCGVVLATADEPVRKLVVKLKKDGSTVEYAADQIEKISFVEPTVIVGTDMISVGEVGKNNFTFSIKGGGQPYRFTPVEHAMLVNYEPEQFLTTFGYVATADATYNWVDGEMYENDVMSVKPGVDYAILAAPCDTDGNLTGDMERVDFKTVADEVAKGSVAVTLSDITSTSVKVAAVPEDNISKYAVYVRDQSWYDNTLSGYGEAIMASVIDRAVQAGVAYSYVGESEETWSNLNPSTKYYCIVLVEDKQGGKKLETHPFTTAQSSGVGPELDITLAKSAAKPYEGVSLTMKTSGAYVMRYVVLPTADIEELRGDGKTNDDIISEQGIDLNTDQVASANSAVGFTVTVESLWPEAEYTAIVSARNVEKVVTTKTAAVTLDAIPTPTRVESDLFEALLGKWEVTYTYLRADNSEKTQTFEVEIAAGVDEATTTEYRRLNRLVVTGYQFQPETVPFYSPEYLKENYEYWASNPILAYRDYGPKIFLEIGEGDVVTVPTSANFLLAGYSENRWNFIGLDNENKLVAPVSFPVTVSSDRNTLTIKECEAGAEFDYGVYRPAVMANETSMRNVAVSDIVFKRK